MTITKVLVAPIRGVGHLRHRGGWAAVKIAHCVGDVDNSTFSENLGAGVGCRLGIADRETIATTLGWFWWVEAFEVPTGTWAFQSPLWKELNGGDAELVQCATQHR